MYSKEQLQKLIDEVSRLIAVEELDKVVPVPTLADAGKVMIVNATGTGYELQGDTGKLYMHEFSITGTNESNPIQINFRMIMDTPVPVNSMGILSNTTNNVWIVSADNENTGFLLVAYFEYQENPTEVFIMSGVDIAEESYFYYEILTPTYTEDSVTQL